VAQLFSSPSPQWSESPAVASTDVARLSPVKTIDGYWVFLPDQISQSSLLRDDALDVVLFDEVSSGIGSRSSSLGQQAAPNASDRLSRDSLVALGGNIAPIADALFFGSDQGSLTTKLRPTRLPSGAVVVY
jgi:hypothetical protein